MANKIPADALQFYFSLGAQRSYQAVAQHYGVSKQAVTKRALKERWRYRVDELEQQARQESERKAVETVQAMNARHLKALRIVQAKALEALKSFPLESAMDAVRALDLSIKHERLIYGEPSDRTAVSVEEIIKREYKRWMLPPGVETHVEQRSA